MMKTMPDFHYPNRMGRILLQAMEEILGKDGMNAVLLQAGLSEYIDQLPPNNLELKVPFSHVNGIQISLEDLFGACAGRGVAMRVGRASFRSILRESGSELGLTNLAFRILPMPARILRFCEILAEFFNKYTDQQVRLEHDKEHIYWQIERCPYCWGRQAEESVCSLAVGLLQEGLDWASSGRHFEVRETNCQATGDGNCIIRIKRQPLS